ncbi:MAG: hypothetical protein IJT68_10485 [Lentisphaeria bacterium]|nr:hypothetical protein [Lentisphaeria bacterium]MBR3505535.1 hypothetical protein [Lentisphaeria bacterium]
MGLPRKQKKTKTPSQFGRLPFRLRYRIACLLLEGAASQAVLANPEVAGTLNALGLNLTAAAVTRFKTTREFKTIAEEREKVHRAYEEVRLSAALLRDCEATSAIAEGLKIDLLKLVRECTDAKTDDPKTIERLVRSAVTLSKSVSDGQNTVLRKRVAALSEENVRLREALERARMQYNELLDRRRDEWSRVDGTEIADRLSSILGIKP